MDSFPPTVRIFPFTFTLLLPPFLSTPHLHFFDFKSELLLVELEFEMIVVVLVVLVVEVVLVVAIGQHAFINIKLRIS